MMIVQVVDVVKEEDLEEMMIDQVAEELAAVVLQEDLVKVAEKVIDQVEVADARD